MPSDEVINIGTKPWCKWVLKVIRGYEYTNFTMLVVYPNAGGDKLMHIWEPEIDVNKKQIDRAFRLIKYRVDKRMRSKP